MRRFVLVVLLVSAPLLRAAPPSAGFVDITAASGVDAVVDAHYERTPKWWLSGINLVDLDADGKLDLFLAAHGQTATAALGDGKGGFRAVADSAKLPPTEIHIGADLDGDGRVDLQMTHGDGGGRWYRSASVAGSPIFDATSVIAPQGRENALIDIDRDGHLDWIHEDAREKRVVFELGDGKGNFRKSGGFETFKEASVIPIDLDGDRQIDFIVKQCGYHNEKIGQSRIMMNDSKGQFTDRTEGAGLGTGDGLTIQGVGDLDQDGSPDLICLEKGKTISIYLNDGKGHFKRLDAAITGMEGVRGPAYANWGLAIVTDFDNDGVPDVLMNGRNFLYVLRGTGGGRLACMNKAWNVGDNAWAAVDEGLCFGDIDGDGRLDLVTCAGTDKRKRVAVLRNDLPARRWLRVRPIGAAGNRPAAGAVVRLLEPGTGKLLWHEQVVIASRQTAHSYYSFGATERHFGLADRAAVDVRVEFYPSGKVVTQQGVKADQTIEVRE